MYKILLKNTAYSARTVKYAVYIFGEASDP